MPESPKEQGVVLVGAGFAGFSAARELGRLARATIEITVINSADYFLYLPLMPQVTSGLVEPRHSCVSLPRTLRNVRFVLGMVTHIDSRAKAVHWAGPEGESGHCGYDRLILTAGSVNNTDHPDLHQARVMLALFPRRTIRRLRARQERTSASHVT